MSFEQALIAQARPHILAAKARTILESEARKGCSPEISTTPVALEPPYRAATGIQDFLQGETAPSSVKEAPLPASAWRHARVWLAPEHTLEWRRVERFIKHLQGFHHRLVFNILGNARTLVFTLSCHAQDFPILYAAFQGEFEGCELVPVEHGPLSQLSGSLPGHLIFQDFFPASACYSQLLTRPDEIRYSPLESMFKTLNRIPDPNLGIYQVVCQPVAAQHDWHRNVEHLLDLEFSMKLHSGLQLPQRYAQQAPSGDLRNMAGEVETKAHGDKPFYAAAMRVAIAGTPNTAHALLRALTAFSSLYQHGGRPLCWLNNEQYEAVLPHCNIGEMIAQGLTYRPGFIVNSWELAGLLHLPPAGLLTDNELPGDLLPLCPGQADLLSQGMRIGVCNYAGLALPICLPGEQRYRHGHVLGASGTGKSTVMFRMILQDVAAGNGAALLDPHGDLVEKILQHIPEEHADRIIYFDPGDPEWVPLWNVLRFEPDQDLGVAADNLVSAIKRIVTGWGDRMEHLLRHAICALLKRPNSTLLDVANLLRFKSESGRRLRGEILSYVDDELTKQFWREDYKEYRPQEVTAAQHKLSKLLMSGTVSLMLSQPENRIDFREIMDSGKVFLANLSSIGSETRETLGNLLLSLIHQAALGRANAPEGQRRGFHIYCDEAHRFLNESLEDLLAEARKYKVSLTLAHQYLSQFRKSQVDALGGVGSAVIFRVDKGDAQHMAKSLLDKVAPEELLGLRDFQAIARIGTEVVRIQTEPVRDLGSPERAAAIVERSHQQYYKPAAEVRRTLERATHEGAAYVSGRAVARGYKDEDFVYEEF